jgi:hypothetical protein
MAPLPRRNVSMSSLRVAALTLTVSAGLIAAGCGASSTLSPTGPSAGETSRRAFSPPRMEARSRQSARARTRQGRRPWQGEGRPESRGVKVNGRITALDLATRTVTVGEKKVSVPVTAVIRHGSRTFTFADLQVGDHIQVKGSTNDAGICRGHGSQSRAGRKPRGGGR